MPNATILCLAISVLFADALGAQEATYRLRIDPAQPRVLHVDADLPPGDGELTIGHRHPEAPGRSWGDYVEGLEVTTSAGEPMTFRRTGRRWTIEGSAPMGMRVRYRLLLEHDAVEWPPSHAEATFTRDDCVYFTAYAALVGNRRVQRARIVFDLPEEWRVTTPLERAAAGKNEFIAEDAYTTYETGFLIGTFQHAEFTVGNSTVEIGVSHELPGAIEPMVACFRTALEEARTIFGGTPRQRYAIITADLRVGNGTSGTGLGSGMAVLVSDNPAETPGGMWVPTLIHELLHMWVGGAIGNRGSQSMEWFKEGFSEYLTVVIASRRDLMSDKGLLAFLARHWNGYLDQAGETSLEAAGRGKSQMYGFIYGGGMHVALLLDIELRRATNGAKRIDDLMLALNMRYGAKQIDITTTDIARVASELAGEELGWIFDDFVHGRETLIPELVYRPIGMIGARPVRESFGTPISPDPEANAQETALRASILGMN